MPSAGVFSARHASLPCSTPAAKRSRPCTAPKVRCAAAVEAPPLAAAGRVRLGSSDLEVSGMLHLISLPVSLLDSHLRRRACCAECCLGTMTWGQQNSEQEAHQQLSYASDLGVNFIDTAEM